MPIETKLLASIMARLEPRGEPATAANAVAVWRTLFDRFAPLLGPLSTLALFERSLAQHVGRFPWLPQLGPTLFPAQAFDVFSRSLDGQTPEHIAAANRALLVTYTDDLADLIGPSLANRFLLSAFPPDDGQPI
ncbi:hypothetical protein [Massilia sp. DD77]|uniref:hypothetical protein n=1 Tax=Massilia sp. DD77 TaxID=3109349 RepID=UPI002FFE0DE6